MLSSLLPRKAGRIFDVFLDKLKPFIRSMSYRGFDLYYSKDTSLITRIQGGAIYEPEVSRYIVNLLSHSRKPFFLDIGANIGLVALNVLAEIPEVIIHAFEPGPHQYNLFRKTIQANRLETRVILHNTALASEAGTHDFAIHNSIHASGDGFEDTGRAGPARFIRVRCETLDHWWVSNGRPSVTAVKIDTEGSEFLVLKGALSLLRKCRPSILMEIWPENIKVYPFDVKGVVAGLNQMSYQLYTLSGDLVSTSNLNNYIGFQEFFVAHPVGEVG